ELYNMERNCINNIRSIEELFDLLVSRAGFTNGNHYVFTHFKAIFSLLKSTMKILQTLQLKKSSAVDVHKLEVLYIRTTQIENELLIYNGTFTKEQMDA